MRKPSQGEIPVLEIIIEEQIDFGKIGRCHSLYKWAIRIVPIFGVPSPVSSRKLFKSDLPQSKVLRESFPGTKFRMRGFIKHPAHTKTSLPRRLSKSPLVPLLEGERHFGPPFRSGRHPRHKGREFL